MVDRRDFLKTVIVGSAGTAFLPNFLMAKNFGYGGFGSADQQASPGNRLASFAVLDDVVALAMTSKLVPANANGYIYSDFSIETPGNISRMGWMVNATEEQVAEVAKRNHDKAKKMWHETTGEALSVRRSDILEEKLAVEAKVALMMGWFMAEGIREILQPAWSAGDSEEMAAYQDMYVLKQISSKSDTGSKDNVEDLFLQLVPRMFTRIHTLKPDDDDPENWTVRVSDWRSKYEHTLQMYAEAYAQPDSDKVQKYVLDSGFYNPDDAVIKAARNHRRIDLSTMSNPKSLYAQAVVKGVEGLIRGSKHL